MASGYYNTGLLQIQNGTIDPDTDVLKIMLVGTGYSFDPDHTTVSQVSGSELVATNYAGGFGGAGRKTLTVTALKDDTLDKVIFNFADATWSALGGAVNDTVAGAVVIKENSSDADSVPIFYFDLSDLVTNGSSYTLDFAASPDGNVKFSLKT